MLFIASLIMFGCRLLEGCCLGFVSILLLFVCLVWILWLVNNLMICFCVYLILLLGFEFVLGRLCCALLRCWCIW